MGGSLFAPSSLANHPNRTISLKSVRAISLSRPLRDALEAWWKQSDFRADTDYIFPSSAGTPLDARNMIREVFEPARKAAGLGRLRFHDLRHSFASILIAEGEHPKVISEQLGHASIAITMDRYSHLFDRSYSDVSDALERAWAASGPASAERRTGAVSIHADAAASEHTPLNKAA
jgi:integrase